MASTNKVTILNFPDGSREERKVISNFKTEGLDILVFDINKKLNGNHCTHVSYLSPEGRYQNIVDPEIWARSKEMLVKALHGQAKEYYRPVPTEISVTADPSRELYLRPTNYMPLVENYENYLLEYEKNSLVNETPIMDVNEIQPVTSNNVITADVQEVKIVDENTPNNDITEISSMASIPVEGTVVDNSNNDLSTEGYSLGNEMGIIPEIPMTPVIEQPVATTNNENVIPFPEPIMSTDSNINSQSSVSPEVGNSVINETPIISEIPMTPIIEQPIATTNNENVIPFPEPIMSTDSNINSQPSVSSEVGNSVINETPIISEIPMTPIIEQPVATTNNENVIPFPEPIMPTNINTTSQINVSPEVGSSVITETPIAPVTMQTQNVEVSTTLEENKSIVTDSYLGNANQIIENMKKLSQEHQEKMNELNDKYIKTLEEMKQQMVGHLKEAKDYGDILKGKFEAQNNLSQDGPSLQRAA